MSNNEFINADFKVVRNTPLSDISGELIFNSDFPYDNISAIVTSPRAGITANNIALEYDFEQYPPNNLDQGITFTNLVPDTENIVEYSNFDGITFVQYLVTTDNPEYPILITDDYKRWAVPPHTLNSNMISKAHGSYRDRRNNQYVVFGEGSIGASGQRYSNFVTSVDGLSWSNMKYDNPYLDIVRGYATENVVDIGIAVGEGSTYSIAILAGTTATGEIWLPVIDSKYLIDSPKGIIRASSWIIYGEKGASGFYSLLESVDRLTWGGIEFTNGIPEIINTADIDQFTGTVIASSNTPPARIFRRDPITFEWTSYETYATIANVVSVDSITNVAVGSQYGQMGSTGTWLLKGLDNLGNISIWFSKDDGISWTYDDNGTLRTPLTNANLTNVFTGIDSDSLNQNWKFFGNDSNDQLNIIELSVTGTTGQLVSSSYGIIPLEGLTGLNVNSYCTVHSKTDNIIYQDYGILNVDINFDDPSNVPNLVETIVTGLTGTIFSTSDGSSYIGTTFKNITGSTALGSFSLEFNCDKFTSKSINFIDELGSSGYYYNFIINDYKNDIGAINGTIYNFETNSYLQGGTGFYRRSVINSGLIYCENIIFGDMYQSQLTELDKMLKEITRVLDIFTSAAGLEQEFFNGNYAIKGISGSQEITKFYKPILNRRQNNIGTYNFDSFTKLEKLAGYPIRQGLLNLQDLYSQISDPIKKEQFQEIIEKLRTIEYHLSYDETLFNTIKIQVQGLAYFAEVLQTFFNFVSTSLTARFQQASGNLSISTDSFNPTHDELTYDGTTIFKFTFDGTNLNFYKDSELLQTFVIYNKKKLNISLNISNKVRQTTETIDGLNVGITNIHFFKNTNSNLRQTIENAFSFNDSEIGYVSQMKYIGLIPDTDKDNDDLANLLNNQTFLDAILYAPPSTYLLNNIYKLDRQVIIKNYFYTLSKFVTETALLRRIAKLMYIPIQNSEETVFNYYDVKNYSANGNTLVLPKSTGLQTYQSLYGRDTETGYYFLNYIFVPIYQSILTNFGNSVEYIPPPGGPATRNYPLISRFRQMGIETFRTRFAQEDNVFYTSFGSSQDYKNLLELVKSEIWNYAYYSNLVNGTNYTGLVINPTDFTSPLKRLPDRKFVFDYMYKDLDANINYSNGLPSGGNTGSLAREGFVFNDTPGNSILYNEFNNNFKCTTGNIQLLLNDSVAGSTGVSLMSFINKAYQIADILDGLTANNQNLSFSIAKSIYPSFFSEVLDSAGISSLQSKMLEQNRSDYNLLKKYLDKIIYNTSTDGTLETSYLRPSYDESIVGATGLTNVNNQFLALINDARMYGCSAICDINAYNTILSGYTGIKFTPSVTTTQLYDALVGDYNRTFVPLIKILLLNKFDLDPTNTEYYFTNEQHRLFNRYLNGPTGGETSGSFYNLMSNTGITYNVRNNIYINVNEIYNIFARETLIELQNKVDEVFQGNHNIDDDLELVQNIVYGTNPVLEKYSITKRNLENQTLVYLNQINNFNSFIVEYNLVNGISGGYGRFNQMKNDILTSVPPLPQSNNTPANNFIINIPPFDKTYWVAASTGNTANILSYPEYNPNYRYYFGDWVSFDNYGATEHSLYQCYSTTRYGSIKGVSPGTLGITGTLSSLLCWEEYHDIPAYNQNFPPNTKGKYQEFSPNELEYPLVGPTGQEAFYYTEPYDPEAEYYEGEIVLYNNAPFRCLGSKQLFTGVGQGIPPGFNDDYDIYWKVIGIAGEQLYEYPQSNGVWKLEPELNQEFVDFTTLYGLTATFTTKNSQNKFIVPSRYNQNFSYDFGDLVLFSDEYGTDYIYTCLGTNIVGINPPSINSIAGDAIWKAYPYLNTSGIPDFSITRSYNLGEVVKYKDVAYKFYFDNLTIQNFGSTTGITYRFLDKVEYGGFVFASKINDNIAEPLIPVNIDSYGATAGTYTNQDLIDSKYWSYVSGLSGNTGILPPRYNFKHDYSYDYNILKIQPIRVQFANSIWEWTYNPLNINYRSTEQQQYSNLSSIKGIEPSLPEPLNLWDYLPDGYSGMSGYVGSYNDNTLYNGGDIIEYTVDFKSTKLYFKATGWGFGTCQINEDGDDTEIFPYSPDKTLTFGTIAKNNYGSYADTRIYGGNDKDNYTGLEIINNKYWIINYGTPKWGNGQLYDVWNLAGFAVEIRKRFADSIELTYNKLVHDLQLLEYYIVDNQGDNNYYFVSGSSGTTSYPQGSNNWLLCKSNGSTANGNSIISGVTTNKTYYPGDIVINQFDNNNLWGFTNQYSTTGTINIPTNGFIQLKFNDNSSTSALELYYSPYYNTNNFYSTGNIVFNSDKYPNSGQQLNTTLQTLLKPNFQNIPTIEVINRIRTGLAAVTSEIGVPRDIYKMNLSIPPSSNSILAKLEETFNITQFYYYSGLLKSLNYHENILRMLNTNLNIVKTLWKNINESLVKEIYEGYYLHDRYYPGVDGTPLMCKDMQIDPIPSLGKVYIKYGDKLRSMQNFKIAFDRITNGTLQNTMFGKINSFASYGFNGYASYASFGITGETGSYPTLLNYGNNNAQLTDFINGTSNWKYYDKDTGEEKGPTATNTWYMNSDYFVGSDDGFTGGLISLQQLSPTYAVILQEYQNILSDMYYHTNTVDALVGMPLLKLMRDATYMTPDGNLNNTMYEKGCAVYTGTDVPIFLPIITSNDLDTLSLSFNTDNKNSLWFQMPGGTLGMPMAQLGSHGRSNNYGLIEHYNYDIFPNRYQFQDTKHAFEIICGSTSGQFLNTTTLQTNIRRNVIINRLRLENGGINNYITKAGRNITRDIDSTRGGIYESSSISSYIGGGGATGLADTTQLVLYQPYGAIFDNDNRTDGHPDWKGNTDITEDRNKGYDSGSANRIYGNMAYNRPNLVALTDSELFTYQGKHDISQQNRCMSILPYVFYVKKVSEVEPAYRKVTDPTFKEILIERRKQESENNKKKFVQIFTIIFMAFIIIQLAIITAITSVFTGGALAVALGPVWVTVIGVMTTALAVAITIASGSLTLAGEEDAARRVSMFTVNPAGAFMNANPTPTGLIARCETLAATLSLQTDEIPKGTPTISASRVSYAEYKWAQEYLKYLYKTLYPELLENYDPYYIDTYQANIESLFRCGEISETQRTQYYLNGLTGTTGYTSLYDYTVDYNNNTIGVRYGTPYQRKFRVGDSTVSADDLSQALEQINTYINTINVYEASLLYPRYERVDFTQYPRNARITIKNIQYGEAINDPEYPESLSTNRTYSAGKQLYAKFKIEDAGEGFYKIDDVGDIVPLYKTFSTLSVPLTTNAGITLSFEFMKISSGYCNEGNTGTISYYGIDKFDTSNTKDYLKIPFSYSDPQNAIRDLENKSFFITHSLMGLTSIGGMLPSFGKSLPRERHWTQISNNVVVNNQVSIGLDKGIVNNQISIANDVKEITATRIQTTNAGSGVQVTLTKKTPKTLQAHVVRNVTTNSAVNSNVGIGSREVITTGTAQRPKSWSAGLRGVDPPKPRTVLHRTGGNIGTIEVPPPRRYLPDADPPPKPAVPLQVPDGGPPKAPDPPNKWPTHDYVAGGPKTRTPPVEKPFSFNGDFDPPPQPPNRYKGISKQFNFRKNRVPPTPPPRNRQPPTIPDPPPTKIVTFWKVVAVLGAVVDIATAIYGAVEAIKEVNSQPPVQTTC